MTHALGGVTPYNGLYGEAPREKKVPLTDLKYMKGEGIPLVKVHACILKGWEISVISVNERPKRANRCINVTTAS